MPSPSTPRLDRTAGDSARARAHAEVLPLSLAAATLAGTAVTLLLRDAVGPRADLWFACLCSVLAGRLMHWLATHRSRPENAPGRLRAFRIGIALHGAVWAAACFALFVPDDPMKQAFLSVVSVGVVGGSLTLASFDIVATMIFVVPVTIALAARLGTTGQTEPSVLAGLIVGFLVVFLTGALRTARVAGENNALRTADASHADAVRRSEVRLNEAQQLAGLGSFDWDPRSGELSWSNEHYRLWGYAPGAVRPSYETFCRGVHPDDLARVEATIRRALAGGGSYECIHRVRHPDGDERHIHARGQVSFDAAGGATRMLGTVLDITERARTEQALAASVNNLQLTLEATGDGIFAYDGRDPEGRLLFANARFFEMFKIPPEAAPRTGRAEVIAAARKLFVDPDAEVRRINEILEHKSIHEDRLVLNDGRVLARRSIPIASDFGVTRVWSFRDVTAEARALEGLRASEERLRLAKTEAEAANHAKSVFLANVSHEIRTPMNGVIGMADLLLESGLNERQRHFAQTLRSSADHLLHLLNSVLDLSKIDAGKLELENVPFSPAQLGRDVAELFAEQVRSKGLSIACEVDPEVAPWVRGDPYRVKQILANLVSNAVKFTERGAIRIEVACECARQAGQAPGAACAIRFSVSDTGIGIPADARDRIFAPFSQADSSTTRLYGGTGLGLAISSQLAACMASRIDYASTPSGGSRFWFSLQTERCAAPDSRPSSVAVTAHFDARVLLAEDNPVNAEIALAVLGRLGICAVLARDGAEAVAASAAQVFDLILMDCQMPTMDGFEATRRIRADEDARQAQHRLRIVALTANALSGDREACLAAGMDDYLAKPLTRNALIPVLERNLHGNHESAAPPPESSPAETRPTSPAFEPAALQAMLDEFEVPPAGLIERLTCAFAASTQDLLSEFETAVGRADSATAQRCVHSLKSSATLVGALSLAETARDMEARLRADESAGADWPARLQQEFSGYRQAVDRHHKAPPASS